MHIIKTLCAIFTIFSITTTAFAKNPSFNCKKATTVIEKKICNNATLSKLDRALSIIYLDLKNHPKNRLAVSIKELTKNQKEWLQNRDSESEDSVLISQYQNRIDELSFPGMPSLISNKKYKELERYLQDKNCEIFETISANTLFVIEGVDNLACKIFEANPELGSRLFSNCYGSNRDNFTPRCDYTAQLNKVRGLKEYTDQLRYLYLPNPNEFGTLKYGQYKEQSTAILVALYDTTVEEKPDTRGFDHLYNFSKTGLWEHDQYLKLIPLKEKALTGLEQYYRTIKKVPTKRAKALANYYVNFLANVFIADHHTSSDDWQFKFVDEFLKRKSSSEENTENLERILVMAIVNGNSASDLSKIIATKGVSLNNALMNSVRRPDIMKLLIANGANVNAQNDFGKTPLMYAIQYGNLEAVKTLVDQHASINLATFNDDRKESLSTGNRTPLMYAAWHANKEVLEYLIAEGADLTAKDSANHDYKYYLTLNDFGKH